MYNNDIQMTMDFLKLALIVDDPKSNQSKRQYAIKLQGELLNLLPFAQSNRMSYIYDLMRETYALHTKK